MWQRASRFLGQFAANRSGVTAILFGIMLIPLMLGVGLAVDYSRALRVKQHLGRALDVAALAIGSWRDLNDAQLKLKAKTFFAANYDAENLGTPSPLTVNIQEKKITISATSTVDMIIMPIAGFNQVTVGALSEITVNEKKIELVMVLDNTGSMGWSGKLTSLKNASNTLLDVLIPDEGGGVSEDVKIGLVPFAAAVNVGSDKLGSGWIDVAGQSSIAAEDFQPGQMNVDRLAGLAVVFDGTNPAAIRVANHHRAGVPTAGAVAVSRHVILDLVKGMIPEAGKLHFAHRSQSAEAHAHRSPRNGRLGDRSIDDPLVPEFGVQTLGDTEDALVLADVLADHQDVWILAQRLA